MTYRTPAEAWAEEREIVQARKLAAEYKLARRKAFEADLGNMNWHQRPVAWLFFWLGC